jgi:hypothetical protein
MICLNVYTTLLYLISASGSELANIIVNDPKIKRLDGIAGLLLKYGDTKSVVVKQCNTSSKRQVEKNTISRSGRAI